MSKYGMVQYSVLWYYLFYIYMQLMYIYVYPFPIFPSLTSIYSVLFVFIV